MFMICLLELLVDSQVKIYLRLILMCGEHSGGTSCSERDTAPARQISSMFSQLTLSIIDRSEIISLIVTEIISLIVALKLYY